MAAQDHVTPSRRTLLTGTAAVSATATLPVLAAARPVLAAGADAELLQICADWHRAMSRAAPVQNRLFGAHERDWTDEDRDLLGEVEAAVHELEHRVFETKATTLAGVKAKAAVLDHLAGTYGIAAEPEYAASLVADVLALAGGAA